jgi:hypothetical protein
MRWAVPSSKVGSCDSANAADDRDSGVDATAAGLAARAGFAGAAVAGLAGGGAVPAPAWPALWPNAGAVASIALTARMVVVRMGNVPWMRRWRGL